MNDITEIRVLAFDGHGGASETSIDKPIDGAEVSFTWIHIHRDSQTGATWLENNIDYSVVVDALLAEETRPRCTPHGNGIIVNLRGVNLHPESNPEDMVSIRLWMEEKRVISIWRRPLTAFNPLGTRFAHVVCLVAQPIYVSRSKRKPICPTLLIKKLANIKLRTGMFFVNCECSFIKLGRTQLAADKLLKR